MTFTLFPAARLALATDSLAGLSVGDARGAQFFAAAAGPSPWPWTDDTEEACCLLTHAHAEGIAGGVAVTVAGTVAAAARLDGHRPEPAQMLAEIGTRVRAGYVRDGLAEATRITGAKSAAYHLGVGHRALARDTVPFALWVAAHHLDDYEGAISACVGAGGDVDTTGAIAGGVVAVYTGVDGIPAEWLAAREPLPDWL